ncbi:anti-sigma factor domain-containing protein [Anaeromicrobium sediminis]|uniref:RsgI N-terminal anti-sigma domain-containing protein n=1 Tax=Anaeromicrobium sediminis TaxID=1478221 RepID=A0A267MGU0_9FIRM|nr:anti-sigma factor domain-containing protein [Anaeromicrobium sediminis]PAB58801.1 hypothetical protein CCE28_12965 [Anaeromicrobium sediminis]
MMRRGMVLKLNKDYALIATDDSDFLRVKFREGMRIGQKIFIFDEDIISLDEEYEKGSSVPNYLKLVVALVACMAIAVIINNPFVRGPRPLYAMVSIDINPSFELGIDEAYNVIEINAMNEESKEILDSKLVGEPLSIVVSELLSDVEESGYALASDNALLVSTVDLKNDDDEPLQKAVADGVYLAMEKNKVYENTKVIFIEADEEDLKEAEEQKLSVGKYRLLEMSDNKIDKRAIIEGRVSDLIKEEEIKDDLETDEDIKIIDGEDLQELKEMKEDIEHIKNTVEQVKDVLNSDDFERMEDLVDHIDIMENKLMNKDSEFQEIHEAIEALYRIIELEEDEELNESYEEDEDWEDEEIETRYRMIELEEEDLDESYEENEEMEDEEIDEFYEEDEEIENEEIDESYEEDEEMEDEEIDESYEEDEEIENEEIEESHEEDEEMEDEEIEESYEEDEEMEDEEIEESHEEDEEMEDEELDEFDEEDEVMEDEELDESYEEDEEMEDEESEN